jgi:hypothetical protein
MSDAITVQIGAEPWSPSVDSEVVEVLDAYDRPLLGIVQQHGANYLFRCLFGEIERFNIWAYTIVADWEQDLLKDASDDEEFDERLATFVEGRAVVLAAAWDDQVVANVDGNSFHEAAERLAELEELQSDAARGLVAS